METQIEPSHTAASSDLDKSISAQLDSIANLHALPANEPLNAEPAAQPMDWRMAAAGVVLIVDKVVAPNWQLDASEKDALSEGVAQVLSAFFPTTNIDPRVQALMALGGIVLAITVKRTDLQTGKVTPMRIKPVEPEPDARSATAD